MRSVAGPAASFQRVFALSKRLRRQGQAVTFPVSQSSNIFFFQVFPGGFCAVRTYDGKRYHLSAYVPAAAGQVRLHIVDCRTAQLAHDTLLRLGQGQPPWDTERR